LARAYKQQQNDAYNDDINISIFASQNKDFSQSKFYLFLCFSFFAVVALTRHKALQKQKRIETTKNVYKYME
jgi:hypothetical protein